MLGGGWRSGRVADTRRPHHRYEQTDPAHRLHGLDYRPHRPAGQELLDLVLRAREPGLRVLDRGDVVLEHDLLGGVAEADRGQPAPIRPGPAAHAAIDSPWRRREPVQVLAGLNGSPSTMRIRGMGEAQWTKKRDESDPPADKPDREVVRPIYMAGPSRALAGRISRGSVIARDHDLRKHSRLHQRSRQHHLHHALAAGSLGGSHR